MTILNAVEALRKAMLANDRASLLSLTHPKLSWGHSNGVIETQQETVENLANKVFVFPELEFSDNMVTVSGDLAVVRNIMSASTAHQSEAPGKVRISVLLIWQHVDGNWKLLARQACKV